MVSGVVVQEGMVINFTMSQKGPDRSMVPSGFLAPEPNVHV